MLFMEWEMNEFMKLFILSLTELMRYFSFGSLLISFEFFQAPDFHRLQFFGKVNMRRLVPENYLSRPFADFKYGDLWKAN